MGPTLVHRLMHFAGDRPDAPALHGLDPEGQPFVLTWGEYGLGAREVAAGLAGLGIEAGQRVGIIADNRPEWVMAQMGIMATGAVPAPMYATLLAEQIAFCLDHADIQLAFCDSEAQAAKLRAAAGDRDLRIVGLVPFEGEDVMSLDELRALGRADLSVADARIEALDPDAMGLLIYTSGTTGEPKGVMLRHRGLTIMADATLKRFPLLAGGYRYVSYLPLCHVAEQLMTNYSQLTGGSEVWFIDDPKNLRDALVEVHPQVVLGVPRVWEKMQAALEARLREATGVRAMLAKWALATELAGFDADVKRDDGKQRIGLRRRIARRLVIDRIKDAIGLDQVQVAVTGAAPISESTLRFFASIGITLYEGYGMSETSGIATAAEYLRPRFGTVGRALDSVEIRIADDGEILMRGPIMTTGYLHRPALTAELIDDDGWVHSGDLGSIDDEGNLRITGRKKDILITAGGKNIAPAELESYIQSIDGVGQAMVVGDRKPYLSALITLDPEALPAVAKGAGIPEADLPTLAKSPEVGAWVQAQIEEVCNTRVAQVQTIKRSSVLPVEFTVDGGELTPTMKLKRRIVGDRYAAAIEALYTG
ncbi:MAG: long-chain fatty acid--CoA ligase [Myxococcota bacterium]